MQRPFPSHSLWSTRTFMAMYPRSALFCFDPWFCRRRQGHSKWRDALHADYQHAHGLHTYEGTVDYRDASPYFDYLPHKCVNLMGNLGGQRG